MLHFFTAVFFALLVTLLRGPGNPFEMLAVFVVSWLFMACLVELIRHHVRLAEPVRDGPGTVGTPGTMWGDGKFVPTMKDN